MVGGIKGLFLMVSVDPEAVLPLLVNDSCELFILVDKELANHSLSKTSSSYYNL